jgi:peptide/nickel transport system substrate-binding protein
MTVVDIKKALIEQHVSRRNFLSLGAASAAAVGVASWAEGPSWAGAASSDTLRVGWNSPPDVMNPFTFTTTASEEILGLIYDKLLAYDVNLKSSPGLAAREVVSDGGKTFTYHLHPGATWHDGTPLTASDVKYTFDVTAKNNLGQAAWALIDYASSKVINATTVSITYKVPQAFDPALIVLIVPEHVWGKMTPAQILAFNEPHPIGSGPFAFKKWVTGQYLQVDRFEKWYGTRPAAKSIIWNQYENSDVMVQSLSNGELDILTEVPPILYNGLAHTPNVTSVEMKSFSFHHIGFNVSTNKKSGGNPLLLDKTVRQAISCSLDRAQLVAVALAGRGIPGSVQLPPSFGQWQDKIPQSQQFDNNPEKAKSLLEAAGYKVGANGVRQDKEGKELSFRLIAIESTDVDVLAGQIFVKAAEAVGVKLNFSTLDATTLGNIVYNAAAPNWDIFIWGWDSSAPDPDYLLSVPLTDQIGSNNDVYYANAHYDALYTQQVSLTNVSQRRAVVHKMQQLFYDDAPYCIMWYQSKLQAYRSDTWKGWVPTNGGMIYNFTRSNYLHVKPV